MEIAIVTDWTSRRLAVAKHSGAVPWHCTSELPSRGEDVAPALLLTCPAGAHFPQTILQHHPQAAVAQGAQSRCTAISPGTRCSDVHPDPPSSATSGDLTAAGSRPPAKWSPRASARADPRWARQGRQARLLAVSENVQSLVRLTACPKTDNRVRAFHAPLSRLDCRGNLEGQEAGVVALVILETNFEYRNAAVRSAPPGSLFRVFLCREEH